MSHPRPIIARARRRGAAHLAVAALLLVACDGTDDAPADDVPADDVPADDVPADDVPADDVPADDVPEGPDPALPAATFLDVDEVDLDAEAGTLDGDIAEAAASLPDGWQVAVVADPELGPYVLGVPAGTVVWRAGDDVDVLAQATRDTAWGRYWLPIAEDVSAQPDGASLRAIHVLADVLDGDDVVAVQVNVTGVQDLPVEDPSATAERFAESFEEQGLEIDDVGVATVGERELGTVRYLTPDDEFDDGVARRIEQWFHPEPDAGLLWSLVCDAPVTRADEVADPCDAVLGSFHPPRR
ncbi:hypothetical protein FTX61_06835 [Nitriliruptoraceae bacterium ZYF776]|nr:hypothetical protein [Profundirhabdus halotolerans]